MKAKRKMTKKVVAKKVTSRKRVAETPPPFAKSAPVHPQTRSDDVLRRILSALEERVLQGSPLTRAETKIGNARQIAQEALKAL